MLIKFAESCISTLTDIEFAAAAPRFYSLTDPVFLLLLSSVRRDGIGEPAHFRGSTKPPFSLRAEGRKESSGPRGSATKSDLP